MQNRGILLAIVFGAVWGYLGAIILGVSVTLVFNTPAELTGWAAAGAGVTSGLAWLFLDNNGQTAPYDRRRLGGAALAYAIVFLLLTFFSPLGFAVAERPIGALLILITLGLVTAAAVAACFGDAPWRALRRYKLETVILRGLKGFGFVFFTVIVVFPFYAMLMTSFKKQAELLANPIDYSIDITQGLAALFSSYVELFTNFNFGRLIVISALVSVVTVLVTLAASIPGAYAIARLRFPGRLGFSRSILMIYMVPAIVLVIPLYAVFSQLGLRDNLLGLMIVYPATTIPVALYMLQGYFRGLPAELEEAGLMDGCSRIGVIWRITMPLSVPALASVALYVFMIAWNEFLFAFMFLDTPDIFTLSRGVVSLNSSEVPRQHLMAGAVIVTIPILVIFLWFEKFLVTGLTAGSVKG
ncbi:MAG: carbohydrate ABC transporter permease [Alphaproteobacteria bacterium]